MLSLKHAHTYTDTATARRQQQNAILLLSHSCTGGLNDFVWYVGVVCCVIPLFSRSVFFFFFDVVRIDGRCCVFTAQHKRTEQSHTLEFRIRIFVSHSVLCQQLSYKQRASHSLSDKQTDFISTSAQFAGAFCLKISQRSFDRKRILSFSEFSTRKLFGKTTIDNACFGEKNQRKNSFAKEKYIKCDLLVPNVLNSSVDCPKIE